VKKLTIFLSDAILLYAALLLTLWIRYQSNFALQHEIHLIPFGIIFLLWLAIFYIANLYEVKVLRNNVFFYSNLFKAIATATGISAMFFYLLPLYGITPRANLVLFVIIFTGLEILSRYSLNNLFEKGFKKSTVIVGATPQALELAQFIKENPQLGYELRHVIDPASESSDGTRNLDFIIHQDNINTIIIGPEAYKTPEVIEVLYKSLNKKINFYNLSSLYEQLTGKVALGAIDQVWFLENLTEGKKNFYELIKRGGDVVISLVLGVITLILLPFVSAVIKISSAGPVFYRQTRVGRFGKPFNMIKFRTMKADAEENTGAVWAVDNDPRITKVGKFLRKTRLDELPQVWNILKGEMSFVGPRAERPEFNKQLEHVPFYEERYLIKPGLTGWAQINFRYGSSVADTEEKLKYDLYYIKNRSPILDLGIVLKTVRIALQQAGK